jgi:hypothetical protein
VKNPITPRTRREPRERSGSEIGWPVSLRMGHRLGNEITLARNRPSLWSERMPPVLLRGHAERPAAGETTHDMTAEEERVVEAHSRR